MMVKDHFVARYGEPLHTIGVGASGGAIQQYIIAQNNPGVLDGLVPIDSYPDMVTQSIYVGDCELMEYLLDTSDDPLLAQARSRGKCLKAWRAMKRWLRPHARRVARPDTAGHQPELPKAGPCRAAA